MTNLYGIDEPQKLVSAWLLDLTYQWSIPAASGRDRHIAQNEPLFLEGEKAELAYIILSGRLRLAAHTADGRERHLMIIGVNGLIGASYGVTKHYQISAYGATKSVVRPVYNEQLVACLGANPNMTHQLLQQQEQQFLIMLKHLELQGYSSAKRRVCHHLLGLIKSYGHETSDGVLITDRFTQQEMANLCGLSRVSVANILSELERASVIGKKRRLVLIKNVEQLTIHADT